VIENGFIKVHRSMLSWEWYDSTEVVRLFLHLLLTANYEPKRWRGVDIERGQRVCSIATLSRETNLSARTVRTCLNKLISTGEVTKQSSPKHTVLSIKNYDLYQSATNETTSPRQTSDKPPTNERQQRKKEKKDKKDKEVYIPPISPLDDISENARKAFACFMEMRVKMKKPMTGEAVRLAVNKLKGMATNEATQIAIINQSIERCWLSFFPLKDEQKRTDKPVKRAHNHSTRNYTPEELSAIGRDLLEDV
jgi:hypothetical protein